jgi:hypothetical protein
MKKIFAFLTSFLLLNAFSSNTMAYDFTTSYKVDYRVNKDLEAQINQNLTIRNLSNNIFPTEYNFKISTIKIYDVEAEEGSDKLKTEVSQDKDQDVTKIKVIFKNEVIGEGKDFDWNLNYKTKDIASKNGNIADIVIPKFSVPDNISAYQVRLIVPKEFGQVTYISPQPEKSEEDKDEYLYYFNLDQIKNSPISASFGSFQTYNYKLSYVISNESFLNQEKAVAIPPDIQGKQQILETKFSVEPKRVAIDSDGNYMAYFEVPGRGKIDVDVLGQALVSNKSIDISKGGKINQIPAEILLEYTKGQKYWETNSSLIKSEALKLKDQNGMVIPQAKKVYDYVVEKLHYKNEKNQSTTVTRLGAKKSSGKPNRSNLHGICRLIHSLNKISGYSSQRSKRVCIQ